MTYEEAFAQLEVAAKQRREVCQYLDAKVSASREGSVAAADWIKTHCTPTVSSKGVTSVFLRLMMETETGVKIGCDDMDVALAMLGIEPFHKASRKTALPKLSGSKRNATPVYGLRTKVRRSEAFR